MTTLLQPLKHFKDIISSYENRDNKAKCFNRLQTIIFDNNIGLNGSGVTSNFKNFFCNTQFSNINDEWWNNFK